MYMTFIKELNCILQIMYYVRHSINKGNLGENQNNFLRIVFINALFGIGLLER